MNGFTKFPAIVALAALSACAQAPEERSLYQRLGGEPAMTAVIDDFIANVAANPAINRRFSGVDIPMLKRLLVEQMCEATGGGCRYTGRSMRESHRGQDITPAEFNAMGADMLKTLDKFTVPQREKDELMALLGSMSKDIVGQ